MLCDKCSNIHFKPLRDYGVPKEKIPESGKVPNDFGEELYYFHHKNKEALELSANEGCHFCSQIWESLFGGRPGKRSYRPVESFAGSEVYLKRIQAYSALEATDGKNWLQRAWPGFGNWGGEGLHSFGACCEGWYSPSNKVAYFPETLQIMLGALTNHRVQKSKERDPSLKGIRKSIKADSKEHFTLDYLYEFNAENDTSTISTANLRLAQCWLRNCLENHIPCRSGLQSLRLPRRVVDVTNSEHPFLIVSSGISDEYVALSYKWGISTKYVTCETNYGQHLNEIPLEKLPKTFREAITVTRFLGFRFLWIDALCIVQDKAQEKDEDLNSMDQIFQGSTLTIFAASADNTNGGLSNKRNPASMKPCELHLKSTFSYGYSEESAWATLGNCNTGGPLYSRGWVLQEEILSRRRLAFEKQQMTWHCLCEQSSEMKPNYGPVAAKGSQWLAKSRSECRRANHDKISVGLQLSPQTPNPNPINLYSEWNTMVAEYSTRFLTVSSDALPALSGLANAVKRVQSSTYRYGLWEEDFQFGLCWSVGYFSIFEDPQRRLASLKYNPSTRYGPTWSWSSVWGEKIRFWTTLRDRTENFGVQLRTENTSESLHSTKLMLRGRIRTVMVNHKKESEINWRTFCGVGIGAKWRAELADPKSGSRIGEIAFDENPEIGPTHHTVSCLLCCAAKSRDSDRKWNQYALALVPTSGSSHVYHRIGLVELTDDTFFGLLSTNEVDLENPVGESYIQTICLV